MGTDDGFLERYLRDFTSDLLEKPGSGAYSDLGYAVLGRMRHGRGRTRHTRRRVQRVGGACWHNGQTRDAGGQNTRALDSRSRIILSILKGIRDGYLDLREAETRERPVDRLTLPRPNDH